VARGVRLAEAAEALEMMRAAMGAREPKGIFPNWNERNIFVEQ